MKRDAAWIERAGVSAGPVARTRAEAIEVREVCAADKENIRLTFEAGCEMMEADIHGPIGPVGTIPYAAVSAVLRTRRASHLIDASQAALLSQRSSADTGRDAISGLTCRMAKKTTKAHCPECDGERTCRIHGSIYKEWIWEDRNHGNSVNGGVDHTLLECRGCATVFYESSSWNSEDIDHWRDVYGEEHYENPREKATYPKPESKSKPAWLDTIAARDIQLHNILREMYLAYDNQSNILAAIGLRTALDRGTEVLEIDPAISFEEKLNALRDGGWIGQTERDILGVVTDAGSAAAHRAWQPNAADVAQLLSALEIFLQRAFILGKDALNIKDSIPPKPRRKKKAKDNPAA